MTNDIDVDSISVANATLPATYDAARSAMATCVKIDEVKDWADKAKALATYAKMARDKSLFKHATKIQVRATARMAELFAQSKSKGGRPKTRGSTPPSSQRQAARDAGLSKDQEKQAASVLKVATDDPELFEEMVEAGASVAEIVAVGRNPSTFPPPPPGFAQATQWLGNMRDMVEFCEAHDPAEMVIGLRSYELDDAMLRAESIVVWFSAAITKMKESTNEP